MKLRQHIRLLVLISCLTLIGPKCTLQPLFRTVLVGDSNVSAICADPTPPCVIWPIILKQQLQELNPAQEVINLGVPGSGLFAPGFFGPWTGTLVSALATTENLPALLFVVQMGGNDINRGITPTQWKARLWAFVDELLDPTVEPRRAILVMINKAPALSGSRPIGWQLEQAIFQAKAWEVCQEHPLSEQNAPPGEALVYCGVDAFNLIPMPFNNDHMNAEGQETLADAVFQRRQEILSD